MLSKDGDASLNSSTEFSLSPKGPEEPAATRLFKVGKANNENEFCSNEVVTSKYTYLNFFPKSIMEQFRRVANCYFLVISLLQVSTNLSPTNKYSTLGPLLLVLSVSMLKELLEDITRHKDDDRVNSNNVKVLRDGAWVQAPSYSIRVGEIILLSSKQLCPVDFVVLSCSGEEGFCYIETSNLDGETNLKIKQCLEKTTKLADDVNTLSNFECVIECEEPNKDLYGFEGTIKLPGEVAAIPLLLSNVIWRGTRMMNTAWTVGVVLYTGKDSKISRNTESAGSKQSRIDKTVNWAILAIVALLLFMCTGSTYMHSVWLSNNRDHWYMPYLKDQTFWETAQTWVTFLILYNNLVPISLYVAIEVVKAIQAKLIGLDIEMFHAETNMPAAARTSNLNEDLGLVEYIFSDKTGTLTCNFMEVSRFSIAGTIYGVEATLPEFRGSVHESKKGDAPKAPKKPKLKVSGNPDTDGDTEMIVTKWIKKFRAANLHAFNCDTFVQTLHSNQPEAQPLKDFLLALVLCHTAVISTDEETTVSSLQASSPDEYAFVTTAAHLGYDLKFVSKSELRIRIFDEKDVTYTLLNVNHFSSDRRCMSVIVRDPAGEIWLYAKGADEVMIDMLDPQTINKTRLSKLNEDLTLFATAGLRTLVVGRVKLKEEEWKEWNEQYVKAHSKFASDKRDAIAAIAGAVEKNLEVLGITAIEDKLQDGVPETIRKLKLAKIKMWMVTGDKLETATNIGYSCNLLDSSLEIFRVVSGNEGEVLTTLLNGLDQYQKFVGKEVDNLAIVVTGSALKVVFGDEKMSLLFCTLSKMAKVVIACRAIPAQKAQLVTMIRNSDPMHEACTLAIGDGANDVSMIQQAHIGIGISGNEGMQAVRASDYSIAQFRYLQRLLFVHGRWNYNRVASLVLYSFYKNIMVVLTLFYFNLYTGFTGTSLYESWLSSGWNVAFTLFPILIIGVVDQDLSQQVNQLWTHVYHGGHLQLPFRVKTMVFWLLYAFLHSLVVFFFIVAILKNKIVSDDGMRVVDLYWFGTVVNFCCVVTVTYKAFTITKYHTVANFAGIAAGILLWFLFISIYSRLIVSGDFFGIGQQIISTPIFWLIILLVPLTAMSVDIVVEMIRLWYFPNPIDICRERMFSSAMPMVSISGSSVGMAIDPSTHTHTQPSVENKYSDSVSVSQTQAGTIHDQNFDSMPEVSNNPIVMKYIHALKVVLQGKEYVGNNSLDDATKAFAADGKMHWLTLAFADEELQKGFNHQYVLKSLRFARNAVCVIYALMLVSCLIVVATQKPNWGITLVLTVFSAPAVMFVLSQYFIPNYNSFLSGAALTVVIFRTLLVSEEGSIGLSISAIIILLAMRLRFVFAFSVCVVDWVVYSVAVVITDRVSVYMWFKISVLHFCIFLYCTFVCYKVERSLRTDYLLQKKCIAEQERTQTILDNMLPRHIMKQLEEAAHRQQDQMLDQMHLPLSRTTTMAIPHTKSRRLKAFRSRKNSSNQSSLTHSRAASIYKAKIGDIKSKSPSVDYTSEEGLLLASFHNKESQLSAASHSFLTSAFTKSFATVKGQESFPEDEEGAQVTRKSGKNFNFAEAVNNNPKRSIDKVDDHQTDKARSDGGMLKRIKTKTGETKSVMQALSSIQTPAFSDNKLIFSSKTEVTILFCDITGFGELVLNYTPRQLTSILNGVYTIFDELCVVNGIQKMETVGKTYMACSGLPGTRADHAVACAEMGFHMIGICQRCRDNQDNVLFLRVGLHTGSVISGVVGHVRPQFSLFGDTVNTASRMSSNSLTGRINVSETTAALLTDTFDMEKRQVAIKGKGKMNCFLLGGIIKEVKEKLYTVKKETITMEQAQTIMAKVISAEVDPYFVGAAPVDISKYWVQFADECDEAEFQEEQEFSVGRSTRLPLVIIIIYFMIEAIFEYVDATKGDDKKTAIVFGMRYAYAMLGVLFYLFTYSERYGRFASAYLSAYCFLGLVVSIAVPISVFDELLSRAVINFIFILTLISSSGVIDFVPNFVLTVMGLLLWIIAQVGFSRNGETVNIFYIMAAGSLNLVSAYIWQFNMRREFELTMRVQAEQENADLFLYQMLPRQLAQQLKLGQTSIADEFSNVTILYSDIKGFTSYSASSKPANVILLLSELFSAFDAFSELHEVYKVQTIGDAYVLVGGLPFCSNLENTSSQNAGNVVEMGISMLYQVKNTRTPEGGEVQMRIGIHTGTIIAGCIGTKQVRYDIWGTDCLVANTCESNGIPGGIVVSRQTHDLLQTVYEYVFLDSIQVKGKGQVDLFSIVRRKVRVRLCGIPDVDLVCHRDGEEDGARPGSGEKLQRKLAEEQKEQELAEQSAHKIISLYLGQLVVPPDLPVIQDKSNVDCKAEEPPGSAVVVNNMVFDVDPSFAAADLKPQTIVDDEPKVDVVIPSSNVVMDFDPAKAPSSPVARTSSRALTAEEQKLLKERTQQELKSGLFFETRQSKSKSTDSSFFDSSPNSSTHNGNAASQMTPTASPENRMKKEICE